MFINNTVSDSAKRALSPFRIGGTGQLERKQKPQPASPQVAAPQQQAPVQSAPQTSGLVAPAPQSTAHALQTPPAPKVQTTASAPAPKPLFPDIVTSLSGRATQPSTMTTSGMKAYDDAVKYQRDLKENISQQRADIYSDPVSARVMQGREAAVQQANLEKLTAAQEAVNQQQQQIGFGQAQQTLEQSALQQAGSLAQPVQVAPGSTLVSPTGGEQVAGGLGGYVNYQTAEQVMGLISQYPDAGYAYNPSLTPQQNLQNAQAAIQASPTYQKGTYGVPGQNTIAGAAQVQTAQQGFNQATIDYNNLYASFTNADALADNALNIMAQAGINPTDVRYANQTIGKVKRQLSSVQQQKFDTALQEARNAFGGIVASYGGSTPTDIGSAYNTLLSPDASFGAVAAAIEQLKEAGRTRLEAEYQKVSTYYSQLPGQQNVGIGGQASSAPAGTITWDSI